MATVTRVAPHDLRLFRLKRAPRRVIQRFLNELATICGYVGPDLFAGPIEMMYDWLAETGQAADLVAGDIRIDVEGSAASARVELNNWNGHRFTDFFTLVKIEGQWQIMSKVFYLHPE